MNILAISGSLRAASINSMLLRVMADVAGHGVTGAIKNGLDWMVGNESFIGKPVALLNASPRATHAYASLRETIAVMSARVVEAASITLPLLGANLSEEAMRADPQICGMLRAALLALKADQ